MIVVLLNAYIAVLALFVWLRFIRLTMFWKLSPVIVLLCLLVGLFIPMGWGAPSGPVVVLRNSVQIVPNVSGQVVEVLARPNVPLKKGDLLFRIDPAPFEYKLKELQAQVVLAKQKAQQLGASVDAANADLAAISAQLKFEEKRRDDFAHLAQSNTSSVFRVQDQQKLVDTLSANQVSAQAKVTSAKLALAAQVDGIDADVARTEAELGDAQWELDQTSVRAPADGDVTRAPTRRARLVT